MSDYNDYLFNMKTLARCLEECLEGIFSAEARDDGMGLEWWMCEYERIAGTRWTLWEAQRLLEEAGLSEPEQLTEFI